MLNIFIKSVLYFILVICVSWGLILISGPHIIPFIIEKKFGDSVKFQSLRVEPDLTIKASRVEFHNATILPGYNLNGSVRALNLNWELGDNFTPIITLSTGPANLENSIFYC